MTHRARVRRGAGAGPAAPAVSADRMAGRPSAHSPYPLRPSQHARPGSAARRRCHPLFGSSFPLLPAPLARPDPHTSVLEPNQPVSLSAPGARARPFAAWNLTWRKLLALCVPFPGGCTACLRFGYSPIAHRANAPSPEDVQFIFLSPFCVALNVSGLTQLAQSTAVSWFIFL